MIRQKQNFLSANWIAPADSIRNVFRLIGSSLVSDCGEIIAVVYELTKRTQEKLFADWAQWYKAFFVPNQEPAFTWPFGNGPVRVGTQVFFRPHLKTFVAPFLPARLTAPGSPRMHITKSMRTIRRLNRKQNPIYTIASYNLWIKAVACVSEYDLKDHI